MVKKVKNVNNVTKNIFRILEKAHAYFQTILKGSVSFQKDQPKTVGGVAMGNVHIPYTLRWYYGSKTSKFKNAKKAVTQIYFTIL